MRITLPVVLLISIELAVVIVAIAVRITALVAVLTVVGLLVGDRGTVSVLISLVGHDLRRKEN